MYGDVMFLPFSLCSVCFVASNLKFGNGMIYPYLHICDGFEWQEEHIEFGVLTILTIIAFDFCCYNATTKLQPGKFIEGTNMSARTARKKNFLFPQDALPRGNL